MFLGAQVRGAVLMALFVGVQSVEAAVVHRCRAADGGLVYRDAPCAPGETLVDRREFVDPEPVRAPEIRATRAELPRTPPRTQRLPPRPDRIVAHECRFGEQRWVQAEACPRSLAAAPSRGGKPGTRAVQETRLTESRVCGVLRQVSAVDAPGEGSARRSYGMNRLRQRHGC